MKDENGIQFAFEIDNMDVWPWSITTLLGKIEGVTAIRKKKLFRGPSEVRFEFIYKDIDFVVWEHYGDSSRYWIGPKGDKIIDATLIESVFQKYKPLLTPELAIWPVLLSFLLFLLFKTMAS